MSELSIETVRHVARLARLALTEAEEELARRELQKVLTAMDALSQVPTEQVEPTSHPVLVGALWREDRVRPGLTNDEALANAPQAQDGSFAVPRVIE